VEAVATYLLEMSFIAIAVVAMLALSVFIAWYRNRDHDPD